MGLNLANYFGRLDAAILNLECCIDTDGCQPRVKLGLGDTFAAPRDVLEFPRALGVPVIGVANNHTCDYGHEGLKRTVHAVRQAGLTPIGMTHSLAESPSITVTELPSGQRIGFWAGACHLPELATRSKPGIEPASLERGKAALAALRKLYTQINIALLHAGLEHTNYPDPSDVALIDQLAAEGFDIVAAAHSHRISGYKLTERPGRGPAFCFYGLGSISSSVLYSPLEREGVVVIIGADKHGHIAEVDLKFIHLDRYGFGSVPSAPSDAAMRERFMRVSEDIRGGTYENHFYADVGKNLFQRQFRDLHTAFRRGGLNGLARKLTRIRMRHLKRAFRKTLD